MIFCGFVFWFSNLNKRFWKYRIWIDSKLTQNESFKQISILLRFDGLMTRNSWNLKAQHFFFGHNLYESLFSGHIILLYLQQFFRSIYYQDATRPLIWRKYRSFLDAGIKEINTFPKHEKVAYATSITLERRRMNVKTTYCVRTRYSEIIRNDLSNRYR